MNAKSKQFGPSPEVVTEIGEARMLALMTDAFGGYGGIAQYNRDFLNAASQSGLFSSILVLPRLAPLSAEVPLRRVSQERPVLGRLRYALRAIWRSLQTRPTVIYNAHLLHSPLAFLLARLVGAKLISQLHGTEVWEPMTFMQRKALEASDLILTVSRDTRARTLDQLRVAPEKVVVLNNTFGEIFSVGDRPAARRRFDVAEELVVLTVARLDQRDGYKGHDRIIRLMPGLAKRGLLFTYWIAGKGPDQARLERLAVELSVDDTVRFLGMVLAEDLPDLYRAADLFALPSTGEGFGIAFVEAMACGTPAFGLAVGGAPDALADGALGACSSPDEFPEAFAAALEFCRSDETDWKDELPRLVTERFGMENYVQALSLHLRALH